MIKNINTLTFKVGLIMIIDASLSFDENLVFDSSTSVIIDPLLQYNWNCPEQIQLICLKIKTSILNLTRDLYSPIEVLFSKDISEIDMKFSLMIKKETRSKIIPFKVKLINKQSASEDLLMIFPSSSGSKNFDIVFSFKFLDKSYDPYDFKYKWTVVNFLKDSQYKNGQSEQSLRVANVDMLTGDNLIYLEAEGAGIKLKKVYTYTKAQAPYGGYCFVNPSTGVSIQNNFVFTADNWISVNSPLNYKFITINEDSSEIDLNSFSILKSYSSSLIPPGDNFILHIMDSVGLLTTAPCKLKVSKYINKIGSIEKQVNITSLLNNVYDPTSKLKVIYIIIFRSYMFIIPINR